MKNVYPIVMTPDADGYVVYVPDFQINTEGNSLSEAIEMARDAIGITGVTLQDRKREIPQSSKFTDVTHEKSDIVTLVDVDFDEYRRKNDMKTVRRNVTLPAYLNYAAEKSGLNVSAILQEALKTKLKCD